ncbi:CdaR family protein [Salinimicrobium oceani]|uniref:YbbR-like domain-containing protein n=1 Tax=Salinimicrobium oceani TaxID=2722702 RepID=A0ABX1CUP1_9FLAO|nr:YbbR-like domain-containing protein [Salinimicrobium oceani]NJW51457.1 YbbR-like domain-containing protein [Salinimicrobium oceani]
MLKRIKSGTRTRFKKTDFNSFLFFLLFAIVIWVFVQFSKQYNEILQIPVVYINVPPDKLLKEDNPTTVELRMQENGFRIAWFSLFPPTLEINVTNADEENGRLVYLFDEHRAEILNQLNIDFEDSNFIREGVVIGFEQKQEKKLPVIPRIDIEFAAGYSAIEDLRFTPDSVRVSGPDNILDTLAALYTTAVSLTKVKNDISGTVQLDTSQLPNVSFYQNKIKYSLDVEKFTEGKVQVPIELTNVPAGLNVVIFPKETVLFFQVNLKDFSKVTASDFRVVANFKSVKENQDFIIPEVVQKPEFTSNIRLNEKRIQFIIKK